MPLLTTQEAADMLGITRQTLWKWRRADPAFPAPITIGKTGRRWREDDLLTYIRNASERAAE